MPRFMCQHKEVNAIGMTIHASPTLWTDDKDMVAWSYELILNSMTQEEQAQFWAGERIKYTYEGKHYMIKLYSGMNE